MISVQRMCVEFPRYRWKTENGKLGETNTPKRRSKKQDPDVAESKFQFSHSEGGFLKRLPAQPGGKQLALFCPVSQREVGKGCLLPLPSS